MIERLKQNRDRGSNKLKLILFSCQREQVKQSVAYQLMELQQKSVVYDDLSLIEKKVTCDNFYSPTRP